MRPGEPTSGESRLLVNGQERLLHAGDLSAILEQLGYAADYPGIAVALNGRVVPKSAWPNCRVRSGDEIEIVGAVQGG